MRLVGERRACAAAVLAFFSCLFLVNGMLAPPEFMPLFWALAATYITGFVGVVACWFWARWFVLGLGFSGVALGALLAYKVGFDPVVLIYGGSHLAVCLSLVGRGPASAFEGRKDWRERWRMDDNAVNRLGKAVMRAGASLPYLILAGLAPKQGMASNLVGLAAVALAVVGLRGLVKMRVWGIFALAGAALATSLIHGSVVPLTGPGVPIDAMALVLLIAAVIPFAPAIVRQLTARSSVAK